MRILLVCPPTTVSVGDMLRGYRRALVAAGCRVRDHQPTPPKSQAAAESILLEALYTHADLVLFLCGIAYHPLALQLLRRVGIRTAVLHTESPYQDDEQVAWGAHDPGLLSCSHERVSCERYGWLWLPHAYDPDVHRPGPPDPTQACDVLIIGTGWRERAALLEQVDWTGIRLRIRGTWPTLNPSSPLWPAYQPGLVPNEDAVTAYRSAAICLNLHREDHSAKSLNPRAYELAACEAFQLSDVREDGRRLFGARVPTFSTALHLESLIREYLPDPNRRRHWAMLARDAVLGETFTARVATLLSRLGWTYHTAPAPVVHGAR